MELIYPKKLCYSTHITTIIKSNETSPNQSKVENNLLPVQVSSLQVNHHLSYITYMDLNCVYKQAWDCLVLDLKLLQLVLRSSSFWLCNLHISDHFSNIRSLLIGNAGHIWPDISIYKKLGNYSKLIILWYKTQTIVRCLCRLIWHILCGITKNILIGNTNIMIECFTLDLNNCGWHTFRNPDVIIKA